ncbi:MAG TPA: GlsB/YeaQ/YmgE family stress response membrane protein [Pseudolysinimonas sp.]|nr:GlsB/YeaQ/YmgE family stress response membrane protein [Pseudolysinimonas sp.]
MWFIPFIILGFLAGIIARIILPGKQRGGWLLTLILGALGAALAGWVVASISGEDIYSGSFGSWQSWVAAIVGAFVVTLVFNLIFRRRSRRR